MLHEFDVHAAQAVKATVVLGGSSTSKHVPHLEFVPNDKRISDQMCITSTWVSREIVQYSENHHFILKAWFVLHRETR